VYAIKDYSTSSVIIKYDISNLPAPEDSSDTELCFQLYSYPSGLELLPNYCLPRSEWSLQGTKSLNDVPLGTFDLTVFLKRQEAGALTVISNVNARFTIKAFEELLPRIVMTGTVEAGDKAVAESDLYRFFPDHASALSEKLDHQRYMEVASKYDSNGDGQATDITIPFDFGATSLPLDTLHVCADIVNMGVDAGPSETLSCFSTTETSITLYGVKPGTYVLRLVLSDSDDRATVSEGVMKAVAATNNRNGRRLFEKSGVITVIEVKPLQEAMPTIGFLFDFIEAAVEPHMHSVDVKFQYVIVGAPTAVAQVQPCVRVQSKLMNVHSADHNIDADSGSAALSDATAVTETETLPFTCVNRDQLSLTLSKLKVDDHTVTLTLRLSEEPHKVFANTEKTFTVFVRDRVEFVPSYDWQPLHEWHTIPAGLETRSARLCLFFLLVSAVKYFFFFGSIPSILILVLNGFINVYYRLFHVPFPLYMPVPFLSQQAATE
jgi:hypothetical protein